MLNCLYFKQDRFEQRKIKMKSFRLLLIMCMFVMHKTNVNCLELQSMLYGSIANTLIGDIEEIRNITSFHTNNGDNDQYDNEKCVTQLIYFLEALAQEKLWALKMADSWGKIPSGILSGNVFALGSFDQCLDQSQYDNVTSQYCLTVLAVKQGVQIKTQNNEVIKNDKPIILPPPKMKDFINFRLGICVPSSCSPHFLTYIIDRSISKINLTSKTSIIERMCHHKVIHSKVRVIDIFSICVFSIVLVLMLISTIYDILRSKSKKSLSLIAFSMYTNGKQIFRCKKTKSSDVMDCLNGIRALAIISIVYWHTQVIIQRSAKINSMDLVQWSTHLDSMLTLSILFSVDTFFLLSGLLVAWSTLKHLDKNDGNLNIFWFYFHRYIRLTPVLAATILFSTTLMRHLGSGPFWKMSLFIADDLCYRYWWSSLLYIQNYVNPSDMCFPHTWYLSVDMQLFILSPMLIYPLWRWKNKFVLVIPLLVAVSMAASFITFMLTSRNKIIKVGDQVDETYYPTHIRMGPWLMGILLGYILHNIKERRVVLPKKYITISWIISIGSILAIIFGIYPMWQPSYNVNILDIAFYDTFGRVSWAIAVSWIIFACVQGYGGPVNRLLSLQQWQPIARLSYTIYVIHIPIMIMLAGSIRAPLYFSEVNMAHKFFGDFGLIFIISILWAMAFESPFMILEKSLLGCRTRDKSQDETK